MTINFRCFLLWIIIASFVNFSFSQDQNESKEAEVNDFEDTTFKEEAKAKFETLVFFDYRGTNALETALGASSLIGDVESSEFGFYFKIGYKRSVLDNLFLGVAFNKYDLLYNDIEQNLISFDLNIEFLALPYKRISPFVYGGFGYNALDDFEVNAVKVQGGIGVEYIVMDGLGIKLFGEYNYSLDDEMEFLINDQEDDSFLRVGLGVNFYFGGYKERQKRLNDIPTQIKSNPIVPYN